MSSARITAEAQLERILYILPAAARGAVPISEIARALDVEPAVVLRDLEDATARVYYHPGGSVDAFTILTDGRTVKVHAPRDFSRPVRLNQAEAMALGLGLRALAAEVVPERRDDVLALAQRLEGALVADAVAPAARDDASAAQTDDVEYEVLELAFEDDGFRGVVADAAELRRLCTIGYLKPGDAAPVERVIAPHRLVHANGRWYVLATDATHGGLRWFRMDRILDARLEDGAAPDATGLDDALARGVPYSGADELDVTVRYSPRIARWISERTPASVEQDGSAVVRHRVGDPGWIVRHVLQYAGEAVVEEPAAARGWVASAAARRMEAIGAEPAM